MSNPRLVLFAPFNPFPPSTGAHHRVLQVLQSLKALGYDVTYASSTFSGHTKWTGASAQEFAATWDVQVEVYTRTQLDEYAQRAARAFYRRAKRQPPLSNWLYAPPQMRVWFTRLVERERADVIIMNYAYWDALLDHPKFRARWRVMDTLDLVTIFEGLEDKLKKTFLNPAPPRAELERLLSMDYIETLAPTPAPREFAVYDQYNATLGITPRDTQLIAHHAPRTRAHYLPVTISPVPLANQYDSAALFALGPNVFNLHGYTLFAETILPRVHAQTQNFQLDVTGTFFSHLKPTAPPGITLRGFVPDLARVYERARFFICPTLLGTGQQIKILDALAHGLAVVAFRRAVATPLLIHGESGFIADSPIEFADYVTQLWNDAALSARMGQRARELAAAQAAQGDFENELRNILTR